MTTPKEALELKPCPFCGKPPILLATHETDNYIREYEIRCDNCGIGMSEEYEPSAAELWNTRAAPSLQGEDAVERVAEAIRQWTSHSYMQLHAGEMTAQERRTVTAVVEAIERQVRAILATGLVPDEAAVRADQRPLGDVFNELVRRMNFDGMDPRTFTLGELERAIDGARFPK